MEDPTKEPPPRTPTVTPAVFQWTLWFDFDTLISISERAMKLLDTNLSASTRLKDTEETTSNATVQLSSPSALSWPLRFCLLTVIIRYRNRNYWNRNMT
ncbi:hypothetical protein H5410_038923 [Solanum commersonii]|uniref:Uncharacterized protein n=1 Tax=Solanum commersonii TaxID=4109 RepID=A0A9J5YAD9_SOLCO|nr:hypothetical protein H5410_038923 [Solanum commersonii]